jgi:TRAP-type uncharacterized transport system fused permease subunit
VRLGVPVESAHMFVLYFAVLSAITPPVAIAVYAACGIARSDVWKTSFVAVKLGLTGYIIPFMFVYGPSLLLIGEWQTVLLTVISACAGVSLLAAGLSGYLIGNANPAARVCYIAGAFVLINPGLVTDTMGAALAATGIVLNVYWKWTPARPRLEQEPLERHVEAPEHAPIEPVELIKTPAKKASPGEL